MSLAPGFPLSEVLPSSPERQSSLDTLRALAWPASRAGAAMVALADAARIPRHSPRAPSPLQPSADEEHFSRRMEREAAWLGLESERVETPSLDLETFLLGGGPAIIPLRGEERVLLALLRGSGRTVIVLGADLAHHRVDLAGLRDTLLAPIHAPVEAEIARFLDATPLRGESRERARKAMLRDRLAGRRADACWLIRAVPGAGFIAQLRRGGSASHLSLMLGAHVMSYALSLVGWWLIGRGVIDGRLDPGWLLAWALVQLTQIPFRLVTTWFQGVHAVDVGGVLKQRLMAGALLLSPDEIRRQGAGQLLGRVLESEAVESLSLTGGLVALVAVVELVGAAVVLALGAAPITHLLLLVGWTAGAFLLGGRYFARRRAWTDARIELTHDLVERMVGHRTRLAQQSRKHWHDGEDGAVTRYFGLSQQMDRLRTTMGALVPRGWLFLGIAGLGPSFVSGSAAITSIAVSLGGTLLALRALQKLTVGLAALSGAAIAWKSVGPLFFATDRAEAPPPPDVEMHTPPNTSPLVEASEIVFRYRAHGRRVLAGASLTIHAGDRVLVEGASGGGKSTLGAILTGLREPESGLVLLGGLDRHTLGFEEWRRHVVAAPQFHDNHVLGATLAFNLLMGRRWPPTDDDMDTATTICTELGLGPLLSRMPSGLGQMVGEIGWQLSHGEKSRLYIARALLQDPELIVLDESFAALDPETLRHALTTVMRRARGLVVIAHP